MFLELTKHFGEVYYWAGAGEVDLVVLIDGRPRPWVATHEIESTGLTWQAVVMHVTEDGKEMEVVPVGAIQWKRARHYRPIAGQVIESEITEGVESLLELPASWPE